MTYSLDLKVRMVQFYKINKMPIRQMATEFSLSKSSLHRWINCDSLDTANNRIISYQANTKALQFLKRSLDHNPFQNLETLRTKLVNKLSFYCTTKTVGNYLKIIGYSKKKIVRRLYNTSLQKHLLNRKQMKNRLKKINKNRIICIDESGINGEIYAKYGWCKLSQRLVRNIPLKDLPKKHSLIMAISNKEVLKYKLYKDRAVNTDIYYTFLEDLLKNIKHKCILMDNVAFHKSKRVLNLIKESNNEVLFIPPYSPDFNPIEEVFSKMKLYLRKHISPVTINKDIHLLIKRFVDSTTTFECYYKHAFD